MATKREQLFAGIILEMANSLTGLGVKFPAAVTESLDEVRAVLEEPIVESSSKCTGSSGDKYSFEGIKALSTPEEERESIIEFKVFKGGEQLLHVYSDRTLKWLLQPITDDSGNIVKFDAVCMHDFSVMNSLRPCLKKWAELGQEEFEKKYYRKGMPSFTR